MGKLRVYYNSACPVCDAGIKGQRRRMQTCSTDVDWIDIHGNPAAVEEIDASREFVRERLHVVDENGATRIGSEAFAVLWSHTPEQKWLGRFVRLPVMNMLARWLYNAFAAILYARNRARGRWQVEK
jgi:predicted DCC family thiol-disulfide oxidoreductase YuxK